MFTSRVEKLQMLNAKLTLDKYFMMVISLSHSKVHGL